MTEWILAGYGLGKIAAYSAVCYLCVSWVYTRPRRLLPAVALGLLRAAMGLVFGVGIFLAAAAMLSGRSDLLAQVATYLCVYVPVRWIEWGLIALIAVPGARTGRGFWCGGSGRERAWRLIGIGVSCLADVPVLIAVGGLPIGRFMC